MNRSISADLIKCFSIFGVVFVHGSSLLGGYSQFNETIGSLMRFCVPCFILIWAFYFEKSYAKKDKKERIEYIKKRFVHLFTVFIIWSLIYFIYHSEWENFSPVKIISVHFSGYGWSGQYFFIILFQLLLLFPFLRWLYANKILRYLTLFIIGIIYILLSYHYKVIPTTIGKISTRPFIYWIPYVFAGIAFARMEIKKLPPVFAFTVLLMPVEIYILNKLGIAYMVYITPITLIASILTCGYFLQASLHIENKNVNQIVSFIGQNTMTIFVSNPLIILLLKLVIPEGTFTYSNTALLIILPFISTFIVLGIGILLIEIIKKLRLNGILN